MKQLTLDEIVMKNIITAMAFMLLALAAFIGFGASGAYAFTTPPRAGLVTDLANVMTAEQQLRLNAQLTVFQNTLPQHPQIAVLTVPSLNGEPIKAVANQIFNDWKLGQAGINNGVLEFISVGDRQVRIEVGDGLTNKISNADALNIINFDIKPNLHAGAENYFKAFNDATNSIVGAITAPPPSRTDLTMYIIIGSIVVVLAVFVFLMYLITRSTARIESAPLQYNNNTTPYGATYKGSIGTNPTYYDDDNSAFLTGVIIGEAAASNYNNAPPYYPPAPNYVPAPSPSYDPTPVSSSYDSTPSSSYDSSSSSSYDSGSSSSSFDSGGGMSSGGGADGSF